MENSKLNIIQKYKKYTLSKKLNKDANYLKTEKENLRKSKLKTVLTTSTLGLGTGILLAPIVSKKLRSNLIKNIKNQSKDLLEQGKKEAFKTLKQRASDLADQVRKVNSKTVLNDVKEKSSSIKDTLEAISKNKDIDPQEIKNLKISRSYYHPDKNKYIKFLPEPKGRFNEALNNPDEIFKNRENEYRRLSRELNILKQIKGKTTDQILDENELLSKNPDLKRIIKKALNNDDEGLRDEVLKNADSKTRRIINSVLENNEDDLKRIINEDPSIKELKKSLNSSDEDFAKRVTKELKSLNNPATKGMESVLNNDKGYQLGSKIMLGGGLAGIGATAGKIGNDIVNRKRKREYKKRNTQYWNNLERYRKNQFNNNFNFITDFKHNSTKTLSNLIQDKF